MKKIYVTYDDAPVEDFREKVDYLNEKGIKVIWYCTGANLAKYMDEAV